MTEHQLTKSYATNADCDAPHLQSNARTDGLPALESADLIVTSYDERHMRTADC
jgi:hypothetical protein